MLAAIVSGRRSHWLVLALWLALAVGLGPLAGKFESAQQNHQASFLPGSAESVRVLDAQDRFAGENPTVAAVVVRNPNGLTAVDRSAFRRARPGPSCALGQPAGAGTPSPAIPSADGTALLAQRPHRRERRCRRARGRGSTRSEPCSSSDGSSR